MDSYRELLKEDILTITGLCRENDYGDAVQVRRIREDVGKKQVFRTKFGNRFIERIGLIADGTEYEHSCILCGRDAGNLPVICAECLEKIPEPETETEADIAAGVGYGQIEPEQEGMGQSGLGQENGETDRQETATAQETAEPVEAEPIDQKGTAREPEETEPTVQDSLTEEEPTILETRQPALEASAPAVTQDRDMGAPERKPACLLAAVREVFSVRRRSIILAACFAGAVLLAFFAGRYSNRVIYVEKQQVHDAKEAFALVERYYSQDEYNISFNENAECPAGVFQNGVGQPVLQEAWMSQEKIYVYAFGIVKKDLSLSGQVWVAQDGGMLQIGLDGEGGIHVIR